MFYSSFSSHLGGREIIVRDVNIDLLALDSFLFSFILRYSTFRDKSTRRAKSFVPVQMFASFTDLPVEI